MSASALIAGFSLGFLGSVPIAGPISLIVVDSTLENRPHKGLSVAIGAALAESVYAALAFWGLIRLFRSYPGLEHFSRTLAGIVLILVGLYFAFRKPHAKQEQRAAVPEHIWRHGLLGFSITFANPTLIATWTAAIAAFHGVVRTRSVASDTLPFAIGSCVGIIAWFWLLIRIVCRLKSHVRVSRLGTIVRATGLALLLTGAFITLRAL